MASDKMRRVVCPHCTKTNPLPHDRPSLAARCGASHRPPFEGRSIAVDEAAFENHGRSDDIPLLIEVQAPWCGAHQATAPAFERAASLLEPEVRLLNLNLGAVPRVAARLGVRGIPALFLIQRGRIPAHSTGAIDTAHIVA